MLAANTGQNRSLLQIDEGFEMNTEGTSRIRGLTSDSITHKKGYKKNRTAVTTG